jgi:hypothetical protein
MTGQPQQGLPTCMDIDAECNNEPCLFSHDRKCTFHCRQWKHIGLTSDHPYQSERDKVLDNLDRLAGWINFQLENNHSNNAPGKASRKTYRKVLKQIIALKELRQKAGEHEA